jgi:hypothetical protein
MLDKLLLMSSSASSPKFLHLETDDAMVVHPATVLEDEHDNFFHFCFRVGSKKEKKKLLID